MPARNLGNLDAIIRFFAGALLIWVGFIDDGIIFNDLLAVIIGVFGVINVVSSSLRFCPVYMIASLSTVKAG